MVQRRLLYMLASALATALLVTAAGFAGLFAPVFFLAVPLPIAYLGLLRGWRPALTAIVIAAALLAFDQWQNMLQYLLVFAPGTLVVPELLRRRYFWDRVAAVGTLATVGLIAPTATLVAAGMGESLTELVRQTVTAEVAALEQLYKGMSIPPEQLEALQQYWGVLIEWVPRLYPAFTTVTVGVVMLVLALGLRRLVRGQLVLPGPHFPDWKLPEQMVWGVIAAGFALVVPWLPLRIGALNVLIVLLPLYFLQGMAVIATFLSKRQMPAFVRWMVYLLIVILNPLPLLVTLLGVFDLWGDFRKPRVKNN